MHILESLVAKVEKVAATLISPGSSFSLQQLGVALAIAFAFLAFRQFRRRGSIRVSVILRAMRSRRIIFNHSTYADIIYFLINTFVAGALVGWGLFSGAAIGGAVLNALRAAFGTGAPAHVSVWVLRGEMTLITFLAYEISYYLDHRLMHRVPFLWEIHKTHHSAEVLTPLTVFRVHPIESLIFVDILAVIVGVAQGAFVYVMGKNVDNYVLGGTNAIIVVFVFALAQLQHSQFWIPLTGKLGRIFLSPAHHQIHHSMDPAHHNRNMGAFLAIWDWMFGTLHVPSKKSPRLIFGVEQPSAEPHRLQTLVIAPIINSIAVLRSAVGFSNLRVWPFHLRRRA